MLFDDGRGNMFEDPLTAEGVSIGGSVNGQVLINTEVAGRISPIVNPTVGDFLTLPVGTEMIFYAAKPAPDAPGIYSCIMTQAGLDAWADLDPGLPLGWDMIMYLLPEEGPS
jgi:hypothetical protein